jgi:hypothetical protein
LLSKWDFICKHVGSKMAEKNIGTKVKKKDYYYSKASKHAKHHKFVCFS